MNTHNKIIVETIMKKAYILPQTNIVSVELQKILTGSPLNSEDEKPSTTINHEEFNSEFGSRQSLWADEEEEE